MPMINVYLCTRCEQVLHWGLGGYQYVEDDRGRRIPCPHPQEESTIRKVLNISYEDYGQAFSPFKKVKKPLLPWLSRTAIAGIRETEERVQEVLELVRCRTGFNSDCICQQCLEKFYLDLGDQEKAPGSWRWYYQAAVPRDERKCPKCGSVAVSTIMELVGKACPLCKEGTVVEEWTGIES